MKKTTEKDGELAISVSGLKKTYKVAYSKDQTLFDQVFMRAQSKKGEVKALEDINIDIKHGECLGVIGKNGCGKSTFLRILAGILQPDDGEVLVNGNVSSLIDIGVGLEQELTGKENIYLYGSIMGLSHDDVNQRMGDIIEFADIGKFIDTKLKHYSSGMVMRLAFAVSIMRRPDIFLIDEVLSVGDLAYQQKCMERIREMKAKGTTLVIVSHNMSDINEISDRCLLLDEGRTVIFEKPGKVIKEYMGLLGLNLGDDLAYSDDKSITTYSEKARHHEEFLKKIEALLENPGRLSVSDAVISSIEESRKKIGNFFDDMPEKDRRIFFNHYKGIITQTMEIEKDTEGVIDLLRLIPGLLNDLVKSSDDEDMISESIDIIKKEFVYLKERSLTLIPLISDIVHMAGAGLRFVLVRALIADFFAAIKLFPTLEGYSGAYGAIFDFLEKEIEGNEGKIRQRYIELHNSWINTESSKLEIKIIDLESMDGNKEEIAQLGVIREELVEKRIKNAKDGKIDRMDPRESGNHMVEIIDVNFSEESFSRGDKIDAKVILKANDKIGKPMLGFSIRSFKGIKIAGSNNLLKQIEFKILKGKKEFGISFDSSILNPGEYFLDVNVLDSEGKETYDVHEMMHPFKITGDSDEDGISYAGFKLEDKDD